MGKLNTGIPQIPSVPVGVDPEITADRQNLPIFARRAEIIQTINQNQVIT
jgi:HrpA-like RNA helicase